MDEEKYLDRVLALFKEQGLLLSMDEIAEKIGVSKKTLYNRFNSKDELIDKCVKKVIHAFQQQLDCFEDRNLPVEQAFEKGVSVMRRFFRDMSPVFLRDLMSYYPLRANSDHIMGSDYFEKKLAGNLQRGKREGVYRSSIDVGLFSKYISFSIFAFFRRHVMAQSAYAADDYFRQVIDFNLNALKSNN